MKLLLVNDDGYQALGILSMANKLSMKHEIVVVAPLNEYSACSHKISIDGPVSYTKVQDQPYTLYAIDGSPADCVRFGLLGLSVEFDYVFSGINHGWNMGMDLFYSGTFSAAMEASLLGTKAIAYSSALRKPEKLSEYDEMVNWIEQFIEQDMDHLYFESGITVLNINFPYPMTKDIESKMCSLTSAHYNHVFTKNESSFECTIDIHKVAQEPNTDFEAQLSGIISITRHNPSEGRK